MTGMSMHDVVGARLLIACVVGLVLIGATHGLPEKGQPPLTAQTARTGGPIDPEQAILVFDQADLQFEIFPDTRRLTGVARLTFTAKAPLAVLVVDLDRNLGPTAVAVDGKPLPATAFSNPNGQLRINLPERIATGKRVVATITYGGTPHVALRAPYDSGAVWAKTKEGKTWFGTTTEGHGCDLFWPCLDFPTGEPTEVALHLTVPKGLKAPSNGRLIGVDTLADGRTRWNWLSRHPNTYGIALNVGPYEEISGTYQSRFGNRIPMYYWYLPGEEQQARGLFNEFAPALDYLEQQIGPYPFGDEKVGVVETPYMGMEHQTINAYGFNYAKSSEGFDGLFFHEFAHEYFANQLTAADWDDMWLHEGYASYMRPLYGLWREGEARYLAILLSQRDEITNKVPVVSGKSRSGSELDDPVSGPGQDVYVKASWMLHTLRHLIGDRDFWTVTRLAVYGRTDPKPGNFEPRYGSTKEYEALVRKVTGKDYGWFFDVYLRQAQLPELIATRDGGRLKVSWKVPHGLPFPMPVEVQVDGRLHYLKMANGSETIVVPPSAHVVLDPEARILEQSDAADNYRKWKEGLRK